MGLLDRFRSSNEAGADPGMASRLDKVAKLTVEHVDIPTEFRPTDLEAWLFAPSGTRVGVLGDPQGNQGQDKIPELVDMVKDRFERLETAMDLMEANIKMTAQQTAKLAAETISTASAGTATGGGGGAQDVMHTVGDDGEVTSRPVDGPPPEGGALSAAGGKPGGPGLLDLYEAQSLAVNPFLKSSEAEALMHGPVVDPTKIVALLLDHMNGADTLSFLKAASKSGVITAAEEKALSSIATLADPGEESEGAPAVNNRTLLTFAAMIEAWRAQGTP
tara:strand:- start:3 stop:830 length:828 start_codon:yes stop_codon:yes gene_type:complete